MPPEAFLLRRTSYVHRVLPGVPASIQFDLARSPLDDDELDSVIEAFGGPPTSLRGDFGVTDVFEDLMNRQPRMLPVDSIADYQQRLLEGGYLPPNYPVSGVWDYTSAGASRRMERDAAASLDQGKNYLTVSTGKFFHSLSWFLPPEIIRSVAAQVKALPTQVAQTVEHGALPGLALGAAVGTAVAPGPGTIIGGAVGAVSGLISSFLNDDEESDRTNAWLDALLPDEWFREGGGKVFLQDLGTILTFATAGGAIARTAQAAKGLRAVSGNSLREKFALGWADDYAKGVEPHVFGKLARYSLKKGTPLDAGAELVLKASVYRNANPMLQGFRSIYEGWGHNSFVAHIAGGLGGGADPSDPKLSGTFLEALGAQSKIADKQGTPLAEALEDTKVPSTFEIPVVGGDFLDWTVGTLLWPNKLLPGNMEAVSKTIEQWGSHPELTPVLDAVISVEAARGNPISRRQGRAMIDEIMGTNPTERGLKSAFLALSFGAHQEAVKFSDLYRARTRPPGSYAEWAINVNRQDKMYSRALDKVYEQLIVEASKGEGALMRKIMNHYRAAPADYTTWLTQADVTNLKGFFDASDALQEAIDAGLIVPGNVRNFPFDSTLAYQIASDKNKAAEELKKSVRGLTGPQHDEVMATAERLEEEARRYHAYGRAAAAKRYKTLKAAREDSPVETSNIVLLREDTWLKDELVGNTKTGEVGVMARLRKFHQDLEEAGAVADESGDSTAFVSLLTEYEDYVSNLQRRGVLDPREQAEMIEAMRRGKPPKTKTLKQRVQDMAANAPKRPESIDQAVVDEMARFGYKVGIRSGGVIMPPALRKSLGPHFEEVGEYLARNKVYDFLRSTILPGGFRPDRGGVPFAQMRFNATVESVGHVVDGIEDLPFNGKTATQALYSHLESVKRDQRFPVHVFEKGAIRPGVTKRELRQITPTQIVEALRLDHYLPDPKDAFSVANKIYKAIHLGQSMGHAFTIHPKRILQVTGHALSIQGLPGFTDFMRSAHLPVPMNGPRGHYAYLPEHLWQVNLLGRYGLNVMFDLSRRIEQKMMGKIQGDLPFFRMWNVKRYMKKAYRAYGDDWSTPFIDDLKPLNADNLNHHMNRLYDEAILKRPVMSVLEQLEARSDIIGPTLFNPKQWEAAQGWLIYQKMAKKHGRDVFSWSDAARTELTERVLKLQQYGSRTGLERSIHWVMFPFSFQKKLYMGMGNWILSAPYRNLLLQEGLRRYEAISEGGHDWVEKYLPMARFLGQLNNFQYGLSPGRFLAEGLFEENYYKEGPPRSTLSKAVEAATAFFAPGGSATPLHQAAGQGTEALKWLFVPSVLDEDGARKLLAAADRVFPAIDDLTGTITNRGLLDQAKDQVTALSGRGAPYWQYRNYDAFLDFYNQSFNDLAGEMGYSSKEGLFNSVNGAQWRDMYNGLVDELGQEFPQGQQFASTIVDESRLNRQIIHRLIQQDERTLAQENILTLWEVNELAKGVAAKLGLRQDLVQAAISPAIRREALSALNDREFARLWDRLLAEEYGPIEFPG